MARDIFHPIVRQALEKDGWRITHDPYPIGAMGRDYQVDLAAELMVAAEKDQQKVAVEVKSLIAASIAYEFHTVLGQYLNYRTFMAIQDPERIMYLAVKRSIYDSFFRDEATQLVLTTFSVNVVIIDEHTKTVDQWMRN